MRKIILSIACLSLNACTCTSPEIAGSASGSGHFDANIATVNLLSDGRNAVLLKPLTYVDARNVTWTAPAGEQSDGASIPQVFWSIVGGPWEGKYRFAALIHDHYCDFHDGRKWQDVHRMFYEASIAGGTDPLLAKVLYAAVYHFGPRWSDQNAGYDQLALLIPSERTRIAEATEAVQHAKFTAMAATVPTTSDIAIAPLHIPDQHEQALLVLSPNRGTIHPMMLQPAISAAAKWERIRDFINLHQSATLYEIQNIK